MMRREPRRLSTTPSSPSTLTKATHRRCRLRRHRWRVPISSASAYNLIGTGGSGGLANGIDGNMVGVANPGARRSGLANNGGPTQTIALLAGSPAIDAGSNALAVDPTTGSPLTTDQRGAGFPRIINGTVDIGAFESPMFGNPTVYTVNLTSDTGALQRPQCRDGHLGRPALGHHPGQRQHESRRERDHSSTRTVFNSSSPKTITLASTLELSETSWPEVIQGPGEDALTISGNNAVGAFLVNATAAISNLTISDSDSSDPGINNGGTLTVSDCVISNNQGGGILNPGWLTIMDSTIADNSAGSGGGIWNQGVVSITDSTIANNSAGAGGGFDNTYLATIADSTIAGNSAILGGGIANQYATLILTGCTIDGNSATGTGFTGWGGGVDFSTGSMRVTDCTITDNSAVGVGGGIFVWTGALTITNSTIADNSTEDSSLRFAGPSGGGLFVAIGYQPGIDMAIAPVILENSIVDDNTDPDGADDIARSAGSVGHSVAVSPDSANNLVGV